MDKQRTIKNQRDNILIILASEVRGYAGYGFRSEGFNVYVAYKPVSLWKRVLRELFFRVRIFPKSIWYEKAILCESPDYLIVRDSLITRHYLMWLHRQFPKAKINFLYENMVGKSRHLYPMQLPSFVKAWTYDEYDSRKYGIPFHNAPYYFSTYVKPMKPKRYDLLFVGADKGRAEYVLKLKDFLNKQGYLMKVHIVAGSILDKKKNFYENRVGYDQIAEWISESRAILNIALENQEGITVRDMESIFNRVKLVSTNEHIVKTKLYEEKNVFVLRDDNWESLITFLKTDYEENPNINLEDYSPWRLIETLTGEMI